MNIQDIAREAGVSIATVSRVMNRPELVTAETRRKVEGIIATHRYKPNALARGLLTSRSSTVGVLTVDLLNPYYATVVHSIERNLVHYGYNSFLCNTGDDRAEKERYIDTLLEKRVEGLVFVGSIYTAENGTDVIRNAARAVPVIVVNSLVESENVYSVLCDDRAGVRLAADHLLTQGRRRILFVNTLETASARLKESAFLESLSSHPEAGHRVVETTGHSLSNLTRALEQELRRHQYDAVLTTDDLFANAALSVLHALGKRVPADVAVVGYNNSNVSELSFPRLTSIDSRMEDLGAECAGVLDRILAGEADLDPVRYLEPGLVVKESSATA